jgi:hypothetical protein
MTGKDSLAQLVQAGEITAADAQVIRKQRRQLAKLAPQRQRAAEEQQAAEWMSWLARHEPPHKVKPWAEWLLRHRPALADHVLQGTVSLYTAIWPLYRDGPCGLNCVHMQMTVDEWQAHRAGQLIALARIGQAQRDAAEIGGA